MNIKETMEMRGMAREEIISFFQALDTKYIAPDQFIAPHWHVTVEACQMVKLGSISIPSTLVVIKGEKSETEKLIHAFRLRFLTAGG